VGVEVGTGVGVGVDTGVVVGIALTKLPLAKVTIPGALAGMLGVLMSGPITSKWPGTMLPVRNLLSNSAFLYPPTVFVSVPMLGSPALTPETQRTL